MCLLKCLSTLIGTDAAMVVVTRVIAAMVRTLATVVAALARRLLRPRVVASESACLSSRLCL